MIPEENRTLQLYIASLEGCQPLSNDEEKTADRDTLIVHNLRYVVKIARRYAYTTEDFLDYIQEGNVGLIKATESYDPAKGSFTVWCTGYIKSEIRLAQARSKSIVKLPMEVYANHVKVRALQVDHSEEEIAKIVGIQKTIVEIILRGISGSNYEIPDMAGEAPNDMDIRDALKLINQYPGERQREVLIHRLNGWTYQSIATKIGISHQRVQQIEKAGILAITGASR